MKNSETDPKACFRRLFDKNAKNRLKHQKSTKSLKNLKKSLKWGCIFNPKKMNIRSLALAGSSLYSTANSTECLFLILNKE